MDIHTDKIAGAFNDSRFHFTQAYYEKLRVDRRARQKCDVVLPCGDCNPATYVEHPLSVFELDFEQTLPSCACASNIKNALSSRPPRSLWHEPGQPYDEETSNLVTPDQQRRWIYSTSKQLMDRIIYAYGKHHNLQFTLFRPFNWFGRLDDILARGKSNRVVTKF